ncbi:hypothetical protein M404DRAFT_36161 [Pisolithus tinctorius Marx 270]|uniref:Uncharacterized protein n=1 Tax=Pisolithus tinctorius Marx 270 TaxID=870435 RepID=A0A0C3I8C9_PISTI|nr:hypothetical protein M404DRAFT_36161 [Pisolithus tinctorius Marx 270]
MVAALRRLYAAIYSPIYIEGSTADLDWNAIRNATGCIHVVQKWIPKTVEYLKPTVNRVNDIGYLMSIIRVTCLHRAFGGNCHLQKYVSHESCRIPYQPVLTGENNVSADVVACLTELDPTCGVRALWFLLQNGVSMDLSVVCNFAEEICSTFISSLHPSGGPSPLHDLVVPRRWITNPNKPTVHRDTILRFLNYVRRLMNILRSGRARTKFDLLSSEESFVDVMVTQMCRMLYILGYNVRDVGLSKAIAEILLLPSLEVDNTRELSPQIQRHFANQRLQYLETIRALDTGSPIRDLIHLVHKDGRNPNPPVPAWIPRLVFKHVGDISRQMNRVPAF